MKSKMPRRRNGARINPEWLVAGMLLVTTAFMAFALSPVPSNKPASYPAWWFERDVVRRVDSGLTNPVWPTNYLPADDFAVLNAGQLKTLASRAYDELQEWMPASVWSGASNAPGPLLSNLILGWGSNTSAGDNYSVVNQGQLKQVAKHFYDVLAEMGYPAGTNATPSGWTNGIYPWSSSENDPDSYAAANVGQAKYLFSFDLETSDSDEDGLPDGWEMSHFGSLGADDEGDADGDGLTNLAEFQQGSDPTDYYSQGSLTITPHLAKLSGDSQSGQPGQYFPNPLVVEVRSGSSTGAVLSNAPVAFAATAGGGGLSSEFDGSPVSPTLSITTGTDGRAQAFHRQGFAGGVSTVTATTGTASVVFDARSPLADGLWSRWPFSEGSGSVTAEATNLTVSGTLAGGATWTERFTGQNALSFSGTGQFVSMGDAAPLDLGEESFSVAFWVKYADAPSSGDTMRIVSKGNTNWGTGYFVGIRENGKLASGMGTASGTQANALLFRTTGTFNNNEWRHVAVVYNRTAATARIYVDGEAQELEKEAGTGGTASGPTLSYTGLEGLSASGTGSSFSVASSNGTNDFFSGAVDDVRIYRKALSGAAVDNLRNADDDANGLPDWWEARHLGAAGADPEEDADEDGLSNIEEYYQGTNPADDDTDGDGMADGWEIQFGFDPLDNADAAGDADGDSLTNLQEFQQESDPTDYYSQGSATVAPVLSIVRGNEQAGNTNAYLAEALTVEVRSGSSTGALLSNAPVTYSVAEGGGRLATAFGGTTTHPTIELRTGTNGQAAAWYKQGPQDREESTISVTTGTAAPVEFTAGTLDLVGHWKLDEGSGTTAADSGPFEFSGTLVNGPQWSERYPGENALTFSGSNDHVLVASGTGGELDFEDASFTVTAWVKTGTAPTAGRILSKGNENSDPGYYLAVTADGQIETGLGTVHSGTAAETIRIKTTGSFNDDAWHAVAAVYDRANATARIYVDGTARQIAKEPGTGGTIAVSGSASLNYPDLENLSGSRLDKDLTLASQSGTSAFFAGSLDETRLYRKALSAEEILDLYREEGELVAVVGQLTIPEDTLGAITLQSQGGGDATPTYEIVTTSTNGTVELTGATVKYYANAHFSGTDSFRFRVTNGPNTAEANVAITVTPVNDPPLVSVGGGLSTTMSGTTATVNLSATVTDIDTDLEDISLTWTKVSGTGTVTFTGTNPLTSTATFNAAGEYVLRLSANDGYSTRNDSLVVTVNASGTSALPTVSLEEPENNAAYEQNEAVVFKASASAGSGQTVAKVEFFEGSRKIGEATIPNSTSGLYELSWTPPRLGAYRISAKVTDSAGVKVFSGSLQVRVTEDGWFADGGTTSGNEGFTGSGGNGGITVGAPTGSSGDYAPGSGGNGGGGSSGGGGDGAGNPAGTDPESLDSDGDGLTDAEENEIGTNPMPGGEDTDGDGVNDGEDGWALEGRFAPKRLSSSRYVVFPLSDNQGTGVHVNDAAEVVFESQGDIFLWSNGTQTQVVVPNDATAVSAQGITTDGRAVVSYWLPSTHLDEGNRLTIFWSGPGGQSTCEPSLFSSSEVTGKSYWSPLGSEEDETPDYYETDSSGTISLEGGGDYFARIYVGADDSAQYTLFHSLATNEVQEGFIHRIGSQKATSSGTTTDISEFLELVGVQSPEEVASEFFELKTGINPQGVAGGILYKLEDNEKFAAAWVGDSSTQLSEADAWVRSINKNNHVFGTVKESSGAWTPAFWLDSNAGMRLDESVGSSPSFTELRWTGENGSKPLEDGSISSDFEIVSGNSLWRNAQLFELSDLAGAQSEWQDIGGNAMNEDGIIVGSGSDSTGITKPILLVPIELNSKDRLLQGSVEIPEGWTDFSLSFKNKSSGEDLGTFENLEPGGSTEVKIYDSPEDFFSEEEMEAAAGGSVPANVENQKVTFARDPEKPRKLQFSTVFDDLGDIEITLKFGPNQTEGTVAHTLTANAAMADLIDYANDRITSIEVPGSEDIPLDLDGDGSPDSDGGSGGLNDILQPYNAGTMAKAGAPVGEYGEEDPSNLVLAINDDNDDGEEGDHLDASDTKISALDNDIVTLVLKRPAGLPENSGTLTLSVSNPAVVRLFSSAGDKPLADYTVDLAAPSGDLSALAAGGSVKVYVEGLSASPNVTFTLTYRNAEGEIVLKDTARLMVVPRASLSSLNLESSFRSAYGNSRKGWMRYYADNGAPIWESLDLVPIGENPTIQNRGLLSKIFWRLRGSPLPYQIAWIKGFVDGFVVAVKGEVETVTAVSNGAIEVWKFLNSSDGKKLARAALLAAAVHEVLASIAAIKPSEVPGMLTEISNNIAAELYTAAERSLPWEPIFESLSPDVIVYMQGFAAGTVVETVAISATGAGLAAKIGTVAKGAIATAKTGYYALSGLSAATKLTTKATHTLLQLGRTAEEAAGISRIGKYLGELDLPSGKKAAEAFTEAFLDNPQATKNLLDRLDADWDDLPEAKRLAAIKLAMRRIAEVADLLGDRIDDPQMMVNFLDIYKSRLIAKQALDSDRFDLYAASFFSHSYRGAPEGIDDVARDLMAQHLKDPNAGSTWKIGFGDPQPRSTFARANLVELDAAVNGKYKDYEWLDRLEGGDSEGIDFRSASGVLVQQTSTASTAPDLVAKLEQAANSARNLGGQGASFKFDVYWLESNGQPNLSGLVQQALELEDELGISIEIISTPVPFNDWLPSL
jgi:hypothetical protein